MWYFAWILGLAFAVVFGVLNAMWYEARQNATTAPATIDATATTAT